MIFTYIHIYYTHRTVIPQQAGYPSSNDPHNFYYDYVVRVLLCYVSLHFWLYSIRLVTPVGTEMMLLTTTLADDLLLLGLQELGLLQDLRVMGGVMGIRIYLLVGMV